MIDLHCHILPGIDDGAADFRESLEMAEIACRDGVGKIVATPHVVDNGISAEKIRSLVDELNALISERELPLEILPGAEVLAGAVDSTLDAFVLNGTDYLLMEFPTGYNLASAGGLITGLSERGLRPVIAHPERNYSVIRKTSRFVGLVRKTGVLTQVTAGSISGVFGREIRACATRLLKKGAVTVLATDAHSSKYRNTVLSEGVASAAEVIGQKNAEKLVLDNPAALLLGERVEV